MALSGTVAAANPGIMGLDTSTALSSSSATNMFGAGYRFCIRYVSLESSEAEGDLSATEAQDILGAGLALMPVQHTRAGGWSPSIGLGTADGANAARNAAAVGFP